MTLNSSIAAKGIVSAGARAEFSTRWPVLLGATLGIAVGVIALPSPAIGVFMHALQADFGWTRAEISLGPTILIAVLAVASPFLGWLADRISAVWITAGSLSALALGLFLFSRLGPNLWLYYAGFAGMGFFACGAATLVYARIVSANFVHGRGMALGLAMVGNGATGVILPVVLVPYAAVAGWRDGFVALAILVSLATPVVAVLMSRGRPLSQPAHSELDGAAAPYQGVGEVLRDPVFWLMALCFALVPLGGAGIQLHLLAFLADAHVDPGRAGMIASLSGIALIAGRVLTGWLIDRIFAPWVAAAMMAVSALGIGSMAVFGASAAGFGAVAIGLSAGAELDLVGYMTARYFGMRAFGRVYGLLYAAILVAGALSPLGYGLIVDATESYTAGLYGGAGLLLTSALLFLCLRRFPPTTDASLQG